MQEKRKLVPVAVNWEAGAYEIFIEGSAQSTLIASTVVKLPDDSIKRVRIIFEPFAESRYFNYNFEESNYKDYLIQAPDGTFLEDTDDWDAYGPAFRKDGVCINPYFYEVQNTEWFKEKWYQELTRKNFKHYLLVGYDSHLEVLAKDSIQYEFNEVDFKRV
ncbi:hypothetical protein A4H97_32840 [Niastella yeongjuensis]|uniref:Uncharacterized protein n=1 Tax=Niastella yeongjuensis TaxID=354355 RepID=A0A1V9EG69_9BACT|nr:hypothetical protein [Niastella yeongjuensis]OQP45128.1 hypothetical protein A4H97_32840 [Niastella yeongjuensis]SEP48672.1 hypothetical protein SAMN05660816_06807 [Niastella yeongjuensis]